MVVRGDIAYVTTAEPAGRVLVIDLGSPTQNGLPAAMYRRWGPSDALEGPLNTGAIRKELHVGHMPLSPVLSSDGRLLCVASRFDDTVALIDLTQDCIRTVPVVREPVALVLTRDGKRLLVANHLPCVRPFADEENPFIAAEVPGV